ncbi:Nuclear distribution protein NUDC [Operophtera brumata]|uniref:Nuclear distribution protein NUDC n=1 Tax=Operophtera brumata TaxID=104452 RepID=A0A0L7KRH3_OPEBR|nr:Nuclear distribution protein NUDC [Operophtera brumata]
MSQLTKYDDVLSSILVNEKSILGFLSAVFGFLARRTDFYYVPEGQYENMGFPPGVAEELVIKVLRTCDPNNKKVPNGARKPIDINNEIMCSTVAQEVEVTAEGDEIDDEEYVGHPSSDHQYAAAPPSNTQTPPSVTKPDETTDKHIPNETAPNISGKPEVSPIDPPRVIPSDYKPPMIPTQKNSETYNGAEREKYYVTMKLPPDIKSSKDLKVSINTGDISVTRRNGDIIIKDSLPWKIKALDSFWSISEGKLLMHLEKVQERWWNKLLNAEEPIDLDKIDCSRPLDELPEDHIDKERKMQGLPTSDELRNIQILKKAWNAPGSPFQGQEFDPSVLSKNPPNFSEQ